MDFEPLSCRPGGNLNLSHCGDSSLLISRVGLTPCQGWCDGGAFRLSDHRGGLGIPLSSSTEAGSKACGCFSFSLGNKAHLVGCLRCFTEPCFSGILPLPWGTARKLNPGQYLFLLATALFPPCLSKSILNPYPLCLCPQKDMIALLSALPPNSVACSEAQNLLSA